MSHAFLVIPPTLCRLSIPAAVLADTRELLAEPGERRLEAAVLWIGHVVSDFEARVDAVYFPYQIAYRIGNGLAVEIPVEEWTKLALRLPPGVFVLAKLHTHADEAYHSDVDAANPYLCHEGAISITVPHFAHDPLDDLACCSVNVLRGGEWYELTRSGVKRMFIIEKDVS